MTGPQDFSLQDLRLIHVLVRAPDGARSLYYDVGFRPFTRELPHVKAVI